MPKLNDRELLTILESEESHALGYFGGEVAEQRRKALQYYYGQPFGNEVEGRSSYVSHDVAEAVEMVMPALMRIFFSGDNVVRFEPQNPDDEEAAKQATDYVNYIIQRQNNGFVACYQWFKDALLQKNGFLKVYWENYGEVKKETYEGLTDDELAKILMEDGVEPLEYGTRVLDDGAVVHDLKVRVDKTYGKCCIDPVPPEEVLVSRGTTVDIRKSRFVGHKMRKTVSEWKQMGYEVAPEEGSNEAEYDAERVQRRSFDEDYNFVDDSKDPSQRLVWGLEAYIRVDYDGDGIAELRKVLKIGNKIFDNEEIDSIPFVTLTPYIMSHKLFGMSLADHLMDIQELKSTFIRQLLDNLYNLNNGRWMVLEGMVNLQDALNSTPGGVVRVKTFDAMKRLDTPQLPNQAWEVLQFLDSEKENRTGLSRFNPTPDENVLNKTATGANIRAQRISERIELIARAFAETGFKDLCYAVLELVQKHQTKPQVIRLRGEWVPMNPREWTNKFDMSVSVGLGTGSKDQILRGMQLLFGVQMQAAQLGIVTPENIYNTGTKLTEALDLKGEDLYFTHPQKIPPRPQQEDPALAKAKIDAQVKLQTTQMKSQAGIQKTVIQHQLKDSAHAKDLQHDMQKHVMGLQVESTEAQKDRQMQFMDAEMERRAAERESQRDRMADIAKQMMSLAEQAKRMADAET